MTKKDVAIKPLSLVLCSIFTISKSLFPRPFFKLSTVEISMRILPRLHVERFCLNFTRDGLASCRINQYAQESALMTELYSHRRNTTGGRLEAPLISLIGAIIMSATCFAGLENRM